MKYFGKVYGSVKPQEVEITSNSVFVASNITSYEEELDGRTRSGYQYDYTEYTKDEYIALINENNAKAIADIQEQLAAAKILLGVE